MKKFYLPSLILFTCIGLQAQLKWLNPTPSGWWANKIQFTSQSTGYMMNLNGEFFTTKDTGNTWQSHGNFESANTFLIQNSTGVIPVFDSAFYLSQDNGLTWTKTTSHPGRTVKGNWCDIVGADTIFLRAFNSANIECLYKSVDRGATWTLVNNNMYAFAEKSIDFITSKRGYGLTPDGIYKTTDGGVTWEHLYIGSTPNNTSCVKFFDTSRAILYRPGGMLRTTNGGLNWTPSSSQVSEAIYDITFIDSLTIYASGELGFIYKSTDGGLNWDLLPLAPFLYAYDWYTQYFFDANNGLIAGARGRIARTKDGGATWKIRSPTYIDVNDISFPDRNTGYAATRNNIYKTINGGVTWDSLSLTASGSPGAQFEHCRFINKDTGIATTRDPVKIYRTTNGGQSWSINNFYALPVGYSNISSIHFFGRDTGYAAAHEASTHELYKTYDGGFTWTEIGNDQNFTLLFFLTDQFGYATVYDRIYKTSDGGLNWALLPVPPAPHPFRSMWFLNNTKGFTVGDQGQLKMTTDGGNSWTDIFLDPFELPGYQTIRFYNDNIGYITDVSGGYYKTIDGGLHWKKNGKTQSGLYSSLFRSDSTVVFAGSYGQIVSRDIGDYGIDSLEMIPSACGAQFKAKVSAFFSPVDSIWFQYGKHAFTDSIIGNPFRVVETLLRTTATVNNLQPDSTYHMRVKIRFNGSYYYSPDRPFIANKAPAPVITIAGNVLSSSVATGNQWYLNGVPVAGATAQQYTATTSGTYSVIAVVNGCLTSASVGYNFIVTAIPDINTWGNEIQIYPNPIVNNEITIEVKNNRRLVLEITDIRGRVVREQILKKGLNSLALPNLQSGIYIFKINDAKTFETIQKKVLKL